MSVWMKHCNTRAEYHIILIGISSTTLMLNRQLHCARLHTQGDVKTHTLKLLLLSGWGLRALSHQQHLVCFYRTIVCWFQLICVGQSSTIALRSHQINRSETSKIGGLDPHQLLKSGAVPVVREQPETNR